MGTVRTLAALSLITFAVCIILIISISLATAAPEPQNASPGVRACAKNATPCENNHQE